ALLIAEGFRKTSSKRNYFFRLALFTLIAQIPFFLAINIAGGFNASLNILFTFLIGVIALQGYSILPTYFLKIPCIILCAGLAESVNSDYGAYGIIILFGSYLYLEGNKYVGLSVLLFTSTFSLLFPQFSFAGDLQLFALMAIPLLMSYGGQKGSYSLPKMFFYWFYPIHLLILFLVWYFIQ
ncbi:hypothetical protein IT409_01220, partial [Candidatus Falkowbacteria bacterium]|nr:hypothetical protein [Candidatus Falkowbacteria bacterium]